VRKRMLKLLVFHEPAAAHQFEKVVDFQSHCSGGLRGGIPRPERTLALRGLDRSLPARRMLALLRVVFTCAGVEKQSNSGSAAVPYGHFEIRSADPESISGFDVCKCDTL
jgi:hypothetical protein